MHLSYMRKQNFSEAEKDKIIELRRLKVTWKSIIAIFGSLLNALKSLIQREKIVRSLPSKVMSSKVERVEPVVLRSLQSLAG